jgi:predicted DsbA family dithiol-disulfide isomerase
VPTFVVERKLGVSGAQPPEALLELLREGWAKRPASALA